ncbi:MAG: LacI family DNA-binding transcriptional regulator [bacterium]
MSRTVRRATIKDIAVRIGVSHSTVSRALRGDSSISAETTERVHRAAREAGYRPNIMARGLIHRRSSLIGIVTSNIRGSFFPDIIDGAQRVLDRHQYSILLCCSNKSLAAERSHLELLIDKQVEGIIILPITTCGANGRVMKQAQQLGIPMVLVGTPKKGVQAPHIYSDNELGGYLATRHLIELGHRRIVYLTYSTEDLLSSRHLYGLENFQRYQGYRRALRESKLEKEANALEVDPDGREMEPLRSSLESRNAPTALFAYSDILAASAMHSLFSWGYTVPRDLSVVGFDDVDFASRLSPPLSTVAQPKVEMGQYAAKKILNLVEGIPEDSLVCTPELRLRGSSSPLQTRQFAETDQRLSHSDSPSTVTT